MFFQLAGFIVYPTALISNPSLECTLCRESNCAFVNRSALNPPLNTLQDDPNHNIWWVKKYCTHHAGTGVEDFILYFPYAMIIIPLTLVLIEHSFVK